MMRFLLVNKNPAVKKIFNITAKKANIELDEVNSVDKIPLDKDYNCIFIDDGVKKSDDIANFKNKMITTKFCIILSKDSPLVSGFDSYIRKPFLPTDIYETLKKEKYNDMNTAKDESDSKGNIKEDMGELGDSSGESEANTEIDANSEIDLSEFSDSEDEFLSGTKEPDGAQEIDFSASPFGGEGGAVDFDVPQDSSQGLDSIDLSHLQDSAGASAGVGANHPDDADIPIDFPMDSGDFGAVDSADMADSSAVDLNAVAQSADLSDSVGADLGANATENVAVDSVPNPPSDSPIPAVDSPNVAQDSVDFAQDAPLDNINLGDSVAQSANPSVSQLQESGIDLDLPSVNQGANADLSPAPQPTPAVSQPTPPPEPMQPADDIDFSQIMALQDEFLEEEKAKNEKKSIIGGDIYTPKGESQSANQSTQPAQSPDLATQSAPDLSTPEPIADIAPQDLADSIDLAQDSVVQPQNTQSDDFVDLAVDSPVPSVDLGADSMAQDSTLQDLAEPQDFSASVATDSSVAQNDFIDLATDSPNADSSVDLGVDSTAQMPDIAMDSALEPDIAPQDSPLDLAQPQSADLAVDIPIDSAVDSIDLATDSPMPSVDSIDLAQDSVAQPQNVQDDLEPMKDAQGAEDNFLESLDFLKDSVSNPQDATDSNIIDMSGDSMPPPSAPPPDLTQDSAVSTPPPALEPHKYEEYSFDSMANEEFDGLEGLSGISSIASDSPSELPPKPISNGNNDILSNLEISPQDNITADYHADLPSVSQSAPLNQSEDALNHIDEHNFNSAFSSGISAEMDSISPNFKAQDFIQDLTLGSETALPDFSKSLKQHTTAEQRYNMLGLPINDDGAVKDIQDLSKNELENLDDEAILLLQENSLHNKSATKSAQNDANDAQKSASDSTPKILDKQQIDDITNILEGTQKPSMGAPSGAKPQKPSVSINNNEFGSLTQEALSEVLGEDLDDDIADDLTAATPNIASDSPKDSPKTAPQSANPNQPIPSQINLGDGNIDIANILQTFPIDKLRELLSGVQITVNITFPTKKQ